MTNEKCKMKEYYKGLIFEIFIINNEINEARRFILVLTNDEKFVFQVVCISGYEKGDTFGYIEKQFNDRYSITLPYLKEQLQKRVIDFRTESFRVIEE